MKMEIELKTSELSFYLKKNNMHGRRWEERKHTWDINKTETSHLAYRITKPRTGFPNKLLNLTQLLED